ncbi:carboxypeptidase-like regulatory domain-containing protein [Algoriphagus sp. CAU 1675]|uniref:carboxypeptidase-like regulatory domain-containing protein n=1 Tax=Algoriphagus sp. CAU 1675 TaxID=3032597 RepID=UPI0023DB643C|nr:carboxypeptidase-like regulatory domain-containing protein [Algoriphagus sp. CAU 1675]MDF2157998.1 carboxypeptidase-like regulatory domain-containing protein [Algoriphagus sp. CAU 1675]
MSKFTRKMWGIVAALILLAQMVVGQGFAQTTISGTVTDADTQETLIGVNIIVKGKVIGTITDLDGRYTLNVNQAPPFTLVFSMVGYTTQEIEVTGGMTSLDVSLSESTMLGSEVVISASRVEESVMKSPVSVEKMDIIAIREAPQASFYDALNNLKGVEMSTQSLTFKSFNTRGFNANGNVRTVQMIDGMDNQAPGLNFSVGNIVGISELDLESVELLPGASSALYGPNAINGILLMNSKNPFQYQGLSASVKTGIMNEESRSTPSTGFYDFSARYAKAFNDKLAFKVNVQYLRADDWQANDFRDQSLLNGSSIATGTRENNPGYNGVNVYGDETNVNMFSVAQSMVSAGALPAAALGLIPQTSVSRTGYFERDLADYGTKSLKLNAALHWRLNDRVEAILQGNYGFGTTVYTGADRYSIANFKLGQYKAELRGANWFLRAYTTQERSGDAFAVGIAAQGINEAWKPSSLWFPQYVGAYAQAVQGGMTSDQAHAAARAFADQGRFMPGTAQFNQALADVTSRPIPGNASGVGAKFVDKSNLYQVEGSYNLSDAIKFAEFVVGGNYRVYQLNSEKTLFATDENGNEFNIKEYGGYVQGSKMLFNDHFKLTASVRYDKNENFTGQWSPRVSGVYSVGNHNFRASYQTGFRIPTTQDQYIDLLTPQARLLGGLPIFRSRYGFNTNPVYSLSTVSDFGAGVLADVSNPAIIQAAINQATQIVIGQVQAGQIPNDPAAIQAAVAALATQLVPVVASTNNLETLKPFELSEFKPERVKSFEVGYKGLFGNRLLIDSYAYFNRFENFIGGQVLIQDGNPTTGSQGPNAITGLNLIGVGPGGRTIFSIPVNRTEIIKSWGWALGMDYKLPKGYSIGGNVSYNTLSNLDELAETGFQPSFNTPEYRYVLNFANREVYKNLGFAVAYRWQDEFVWQSSFVGPAVSSQQLSVMPAFGTFDAQLSYKLKSMKSILKVGASNLFSNGYRQAWGNPTVGTMYFVSLSFDEFLN